MTRVELNGQRFGELTVEHRALTGPYGARWVCRCACGHLRVVYSYELRGERVRRCRACSRRRMQAHAARLGRQKRRGR